jgi:hypothetical protein
MPNETNARYFATFHRVSKFMANQPKLPTYLTWFFIVAVVALIHHFACTVVYSTADLGWPRNVRAYAEQYSVPFFHQGWKLFAPDVPNLHYALLYRFSSDNHWSVWEDTDELTGVSQHHRMGYMARKLQMYLASDMRKNLYADEAGKLQYDRIVIAKPYYRMVYWVVRRHEILRGDRPDSLQLRMDVIYAQPFEGGVKPETQAFEFPVYQLNESP